MEPRHVIARLGHVEVYTDRNDENLDHFTRMYGLTLSAEDETSTCPRPKDEYEFHTVKLIRHHVTKIGRVAYRATSPNALQWRVR